MKHLIAVTAQALFYLVIVCLLFGCTTKSTKPKEPVFAVSTHALSMSLDSIMHVENVNVNGVEQTVNDKVTTQLVVEMVNGRNFPTTDDDIKQTAIKIARQIRHALKDPNSFDTYKVLFVTKDKNGNTRYTGQILKKEEI